MAPRARTFYQKTICHPKLAEDITVELRYEARENRNQDLQVIPGYWALRIPQLAEETLQVLRDTPELAWVVQAAAYHKHDMHAGTVAQELYYQSRGLTYDTMRAADYPDKAAYTYGTAWLVAELPEGVVQHIQQGMSRQWGRPWDENYDLPTVCSPHPRYLSNEQHGVPQELTLYGPATAWPELDMAGCTPVPVVRRKKTVGYLLQTPEGLYDAAQQQVASGDEHWFRPMHPLYGWKMKARRPVNYTKETQWRLQITAPNGQRLAVPWGSSQAQPYQLPDLLELLQHLLRDASYADSDLDYFCAEMGYDTVDGRPIYRACCRIRDGMERLQVPDAVKQWVLEQDNDPDPRAVLWCPPDDWVAPSP